MRKRVLRVLVVSLIIAAAVTVGYKQYRLSKYSTRVNEGDFSIVYSLTAGNKGYMLEETISADGSYYSVHRRMSTGNETVSEGKLSEEEVRRFLMDALKNGIMHMSDDINAQDLYDGPERFFVIRFGETVFRVGGYGPALADESFERIQDSYDTIVQGADMKVVERTEGIDEVHVLVVE